MIPDQVFLDWEQIFYRVISMLMSNPLTSAFFYTVVISIVANLIYRLSTPKEGDS